MKTSKVDAGLQKAREKWGKRYDENGNQVDYTDAEIRELESTYARQAAEYKGVPMTQRLEVSIEEICVYRMEIKRCIAKGDSAGAKRYSDMINSVMSREAMKVGDKKPLESTRIDTVVVNLERKGAVRDGKLVGRKELLELLAADHPRYHTSIDVIDEIIFQMVNTMRKNNGQPELDRLPEESKVKDVFGELLAEPTEKEKRAFIETGTGPLILRQEITG